VHPLPATAQPGAAKDPLQRKLNEVRDEDPPKVEARAPEPQQRTQSSHHKLPPAAKVTAWTSRRARRLTSRRCKTTFAGGSSASTDGRASARTGGRGRAAAAGAPACSKAERSSRRRA